MKSGTINVKVDLETKNEVNKILQELGLNISVAISMLFQQIIHLKGLPFAVRLPNELTMQAIRDLESGKGVKFNSVEDLLKDLKS
jgi:DNA-damage-inducible protein J